MRLQEFDILKGIGILLVVLGHTGISGLPYTYIYAFHMPLFFFVSGCFYKPYPFMEILKKRSKSLLLPWLSFAILFLLTNTAITYFETSDLGNSIISNLMGIDVTDEDSRSLFRTIWFLISLFEVSIIYALLDKLSLTKNGGAIICFISGIYISQHVDLPLFIDTSLSCIIYYHIGYEFMHSKYVQKDIKKYTPWISILLLSIIIVYLRPKVNMSRNIYPWYLPAISIPYIICLYYIIKQLPPTFPRVINTWLCNFGKDSLLILGFHRFFFIIFEPISPLIGIGGLALCGIKFIVVIPLIYIIKSPIEKYLPYFIGRTKVI